MALPSSSCSSFMSSMRIIACFIVICSHTASAFTVPSLSFLPSARRSGNSWRMSADKHEQDWLSEQRRKFISAGVSIAAGSALYPRVAFAEEATEKTFKRAGKEIQISQAFNEQRKNGLAVYEGNLVLTSYMEALTPKYWKGKKVLELGCGTGLGSITASLLGAGVVTASDREPAVLALAETNLERNIGGRGQKYSMARVNWGTDQCAPDTAAYMRDMGQCWEPAARPQVFKFTAKSNAIATFLYQQHGLFHLNPPPSHVPLTLYREKGGYDVVIGADLTYTSGLVPNIIDTIQKLGSDNVEVILCWCEPALFTWNSNVMEELNEGIKTFDAAFNVEKITEGEAFKGHDNTFVLRMTRKSK